MSYTPAPWFWLNDESLCSHAQFKPVVMTGGELLTRGDDGRLEKMHSDHPNARLIAAAPELLEACEAALAVTEPEGARATSDIIRRAINKAKGQTT